MPSPVDVHASEPAVLFFTQGRSVPASRFRVEQLVPHLVREGFPCTVLPCEPSVYGDVDLPWVHGWRREIVRPLSLLCRLRQLRQVDSHAVVYLQRPMVEHLTARFEGYVARRRPLIFDFDDAIFHNVAGLARFKLRRIIDLATHVVVGNAYLYDFVRRPDKTTILPTVVDLEHYAPRPDPDGPFTIAWTGSAGNLIQLRPIVPALQTVLRETGGRLLVVADRCDAPWLKGLPLDFVRWTPETEVAALQSAHVGIMPLADRPYNRGKCGFKLIQYMARAIPVVCSPVGANREIARAEVDGFHALSTSDWSESLLALARDRDLRRRLGESGRVRVEERYCVAAVLPHYTELFRALSRGCHAGTRRITSNARSFSINGD